MPLSDLVRNLNNHHAKTAPDFASKTPFVATEGRVFANFAGIRLESNFIPVVETATGQSHGHAGTLRAFSLASGLPLLPESVFVLPTDDAEFVYLDRLVRTLHALNYLIHRKPGNLLLPVHSRHIASVASDHGLAFEEILRPCGLVPDPITLEIEIDGLEDTAHLKRAIRSYQARGYGIALSRFGRGHPDIGLLRELNPDIVKFDRQLLASSLPLERLIEAVHQLGARVLVEGIDTVALRRGAAAQYIDLIQAQPPLRRLIHAGTSAGATFAAGDTAARNAA